MIYIRNFLIIVILFVFTACGNRNTTKYQTVPDNFIHGYVVDNYIENATVCVDTNHNNSCEDEESQFITRTDENGSFGFKIELTDDMTLIAYGGKDATTNEDFKYLLKNYSINKDKNDKIILSSITTLIVEVKNNANITLNEAKERVNSFLGGSSNNIQTTNIIQDIIANKDTQVDEFYMSLKLFDMIDQGTNTLNPTNSINVFKKLASLINNNLSLTHESNASLLIIENDGEEKSLYVQNTTPIFIDNTIEPVASGSRFVVDLSTLVVNPDGNSLVFSLIDGNETFEINGNYLEYLQSPTYKVNGLNEYNVTVEALNGSKSKQMSFTFYVEDSNTNAPNITFDKSISIDENEVYVGIITATDNDNNSLTFSLSGTDPSSFEIDAQSGELNFKTAPDYETKSSYSLLLTVSDGTYSDTQALNINIANLNDNAPTFSLSDTINVFENNTSLYDIDANDVDNDTLIYSLGGTDADSFNIDSETGIVTFKTAPDYETKSSYELSVIVSDGVHEISKALNINVQNVNDIAPIISSANSVNVNENQINVMQVIASDVENDNLTYTLSDFNSSLFDINTSGYITFKDINDSDYEKSPQYKVNVNVSDGVHTERQLLTIHLNNDVNENGNDAPSDITLSNNSINENNAPNILLGTLSSIDTDDTSGFTYGISGTDSGLFSIANTNELQINTATNFEVKSLYQITVSSTDPHGASFSKDFNISINDLNEEATFESIGIQNILEDHLASFIIKAHEVDANGTLRSTSGNDFDGTSFAITQVDGNNTQDINITVSGTAIDSEVGLHTFKIFVKQTDNGENIFQNVDVNVTNVNDAPVFTGDDSNKIINFTETKDYTFIIGDGDISEDQTLSVSGSSSDTGVATLSIDDSNLNVNGDIVVSITGVSSGESNITITLNDDGGTLNGGEDESNISFGVTVRPTGWKIYNDRKIANNNVNGHSIEFDNIIYTWNSTNKWYETANTILMPVKILTNSNYEGSNFNKIGEGHYSINKSNIISDYRRTIAYDPSNNNNFTAVDGVTTYDNVSLENFNYDPEHYLFVSMILKDDTGNGIIQSYTQWTDINNSDNNGTNYANAPDQNETYSTDVNMSSAYVTSAVQIDYNNDGNSTDGYCAKRYGEGWRLPTSYEIGMNVSSGNSGDYGYIPAYVGDGSTTYGNEIISSSKVDSNNNWSIKHTNGRTNKFGGLTGLSAKCVYSSY